MTPLIDIGFPDGTVVKNLPANAGDARDAGSILGSGRSPGRGNDNLLQYSCLVGYSLWGHKESDTSEQLTTHTHTHARTHAHTHTHTHTCSGVGESSDLGILVLLESTAWGAAIHGVAKSWTQLSD